MKTVKVFITAGYMLKDNVFCTVCVCVPVSLSVCVSVRTTTFLMPGHRISGLAEHLDYRYLGHWVKV